ncbi:type II secretion system protein GspM [Phytohalomonas tamaricis]|uniref:type II secretion system protein GspM n=1 Tax=Phytohalomonas tamaricis TaxID=2081032 RepID=UPI000D0B24B6|nr:type II secretion system protein GspM [Phytohalomonas tamaricis]
MRRTLTRRESRMAALLILALALCLIYWASVHVWFIAPQHVIDEQMETLRQAQLRYTAVQAQREPLLKQLKQAQASDADDKSLLPGEDPSAVTAGLMQSTADIIAQHGAEGAGCELINRTPMSNTSSDGPNIQVKVSVKLSCAIKPLEAILYDLETARPFLFVEELHVERQDDAPPTGGAGRLNVEMLVTGYMQRSVATTEENEAP